MAKTPVDLDELRRRFHFHFAPLGLTLSLRNAVEAAIADVTPETDDALRARIVQLVRDRSGGDLLDSLARNVGLCRKNVDRVDRSDVVRCVCGAITGIISIP